MSSREILVKGARSGKKTKEQLRSLPQEMSVPLLDITLNDIALVLVWFLIAAVFYLVLYHTYWHEQRGPHAFAATTPEQPEAKEKQPDTFLVLDVEGTCIPGTSFDWPNEIIVGTLAEWARAASAYCDTSSTSRNGQ